MERENIYVFERELIESSRVELALGVTNLDQLFLNVKTAGNSHLFIVEYGDNLIHASPRNFCSHKLLTQAFPYH